MSVKSDLSCLSKVQANVVQSALEKLNLKGKEAYIEPLGKVDDNFIADVRVITVKSDDNNSLRIIVKIPPQSGDKTAMTTALFNNEIIMYKEILPTFSTLQKNAGVELKNAFQFATCYGACTEEKQEILLLEDLTKHNYVLLDKYEPLPNETIKLVLQKLADFHSLSYALKYKNPDKFKVLSEKLINMNTAMNIENELNSYTAMGEGLSQMFDDDKYKNVMKNLLTLESFEKDKKLKELDMGSKYNVIIHGDIWTNNILFKLENEKPSQCIFIDYQIVMEGSPVMDIMYLIFNCTDYATRSKHYYEWLDYYHTQLEKSLSNFGLKVNNVYPKDKLDSDMTRYAKSTLMMALMSLPMLLSSHEASAMKNATSQLNEMDSLGDQKQLTNLEASSAFFVKEDIEGIIDSCFDFGLLSIN